MKKIISILLFICFFGNLSYSQKLNSTIVKTIENQGASITGVKFTPDSKQFIVFNDKYELSVYDVVYDKFVLNKKIKDSRIEHFDRILINENQNIYFYTESKYNGLTINFYKLTGNNFTKDFSFTISDTKKFTYSLAAVSPNLKYLIVDRYNNKKRQYDMLIYEISNKNFKLSNKYINNSSSGTVFSEDQNYIVSGYPTKLFYLKKNKVRFFTENEAYIKKMWEKNIYYVFKPNSEQHEFIYNGVTINEGSSFDSFADLKRNYIYIISYGKEINSYLIKDKSYKLIKQNILQDKGGYKNHYDLSKDGNYFVNAWGPEIYLYYVNNGHFQLIFKHIDEIVENRAREAKFSTNNSYLATYSENWSLSVIKVYDFKNNISLINQIKNENIVDFINDSTLLTQKGSWYKFYTYNGNKFNIDSTYHEMDYIYYIYKNNIINFEKGYYKKYKSRQNFTATHYKIKNNNFEKIRTVTMSYKFLQSIFNNSAVYSNSGKYFANITCGHSQCYYNVFDAENNFTKISSFNSSGIDGEYKIFSDDDRYLFFHNIGNDAKLYVYYNSGNSFNFLQEIKVPDGFLWSNSIEISYDNKYMITCVGNKFHITQINGEH